MNHTMETTGCRKKKKKVAVNEIKVNDKSTLYNFPLFISLFHLTTQPTDKKKCQPPLFSAEKIICKKLPTHRASFFFFFNAFPLTFFFL